MFRITLVLFFIFYLPASLAVDIDIIHNDKVNPALVDRAGYRVVKHNLDELPRLLASLTGSLPRTEALAAPIVKQRMSALGGRIQTASVAGTLLSRYDIKKLPAIVFNGGSHVYYGSNLAAAIKRYEALQ